MWTVSTSPPPSGVITSDRSPYYDKRWLILAVVLAAECMDLIDSTVVNVAAPQIAHDFHASSTALQWIVGGYPLSIAVGLIMGGRLGDLVGRKKMFIIGSFGFVAASALCGAAPNFGRPDLGPSNSRFLCRAHAAPGVRDPARSVSGR
jgi:MFS family permease